MSLSCGVPGSSPSTLPERRLADADRSRVVERSRLGSSVRPRANEVLEARGAPVGRKGESAREGGAAAAAEMLLPLKWAEVALVSSRLPFRRSGNRLKVRRRLLERAAGAGVVVAVAAAAIDGTSFTASRSNRSSFSGPMSVVSPEEEEAEEERSAAETDRGRNGVVKGIAVRGRMVAESRRRLTKGERVGTLARIGRPLYARQSLGGP